MQLFVFLLLFFLHSFRFILFNDLMRMYYKLNLNLVIPS